MATWDGVIVNDGNKLLNSWVAGKSLTFDHAAAGTGYVADIPLMAQSALVNQKQIASIVGAEKTPEGYKLKLQVTPIDTGYTLNQFGVWASVTGGSVVMLAIFQNKAGIPIPSKAETPDFAYTFFASIMCSNTGEWTVNFDTSALVTYGDMEDAIEEAVAVKQDKITATGILKGTGNGGVTAATPGEDYGLPLPTLSGAPTADTVGIIGQHYFDTTSEKEYVCVGITEKEEGGYSYAWKLAGISDSADISWDNTTVANGLGDAHLAASVLFEAVRQNAWQIERGVITLTNSKEFPFNDSLVSVPLSILREGSDYAVVTYVVSADGNVGEIEVTEKLSNGFKLAFTGSATSVTVKYAVIGGYLK